MLVTDSGISISLISSLSPSKFFIVDGRISFFLTGRQRIFKFFKSITDLPSKNNAENKFFESKLA